ncbi:DUF1010 domain-containing protein [Acidovorax sp. IB03]|nr:DUF1010 domain-containing protein [Acidovorax sp. IB03]MBP6579882.1 DUF1010 domain-containing protein [Acidovorax sp.]
MCAAATDYSVSPSSKGFQAFSASSACAESVSRSYFDSDASLRCAARMPWLKKLAAQRGTANSIY